MKIPNIRKMKFSLTTIALFLSAISIALLTGILYTLFENGTPIVNIVVGGTYFLGVNSLFLMYRSRLYEDPQRRIVMFVGGFMGIMLAFFSLEMMLWLGIK